MSLSALTLIIGNLVPLAGVLWWGWDLSMIMILYWAESAVIGYYNVFKMAKVGGWEAVFTIPFFIVHYGGFMMGHLLFILALFGGNEADTSSFGSMFSVVPHLVRDILPGLITLFVSHGISFATNFIGKGEYRTATVNELMFQPYKRIIVMHLTIIFGGFLSEIFHAHVLALLLMIILKTMVDLVAHGKEHAPARLAHEGV